MTTFNNKLSIFIPRVLSEWANEDSISIIFKKLDIGEVERVDFVEKKNQYNKIYYHAFVHFKEWKDTAISRNIQEKIFDPEQVAKIVYHVEHAVSIQSCYDVPKYWILLKNNNPMTANEVKQEKRIVELEEQNMNQNKIMLNYLNRITNLETQLHQMQTTYWNSQMASKENSFNVRSPPPQSPSPPPSPSPPSTPPPWSPPPPPPAPPQLVRQTNSHELADNNQSDYINNDDGPYLEMTNERYNATGESDWSRDALRRPWLWGEEALRRAQYESNDTGSYIHRPDYEERESYNNDYYP